MLTQLSFAIALLPLMANAASPFAGRWDLTISTANDVYPSWMAFADEGGQPAVRIVGRTGSVYPARDPKVQGSRLTLADPPWDLTVKNGQISGRTPDGAIAGVPAPPLDRKPPKSWSAPEPLSGWAAGTQWVAQNGELQNPKAGANLRTLRSFDDFKLHIEYNCPPGGNSGVYLRGRYEVQVEYEPAGKNDGFHSMGSIYGFIPPSADVAPRPGQWESYDITLVGRTVTVLRDGVLIIDSAEIPGITGGALDSRESEPGPIYLQGDHTGGLALSQHDHLGPALVCGADALVRAGPPGPTLHSTVNTTGCSTIDALFGVKNIR
jgi:Domain of Unknown Function (DUF1080)